MEVWVGFLSFGSSCFFPGVSAHFALVLDPRDGLGGKIGNGCEEFEANECGMLGWWEFGCQLTRDVPDKCL